MIAVAKPTPLDMVVSITTIFRCFPSALAFRNPKVFAGSTKDQCCFNQVSQLLYKTIVGLGQWTRIIEVRQELNVGPPSAGYPWVFCE
jgi:hypothetical protein